MKIFTRGLILVGVPLLVEVVLISSLGYLLVQSDKAQIREVHSRRFSALSGRMVTAAFEAPYTLVICLQTRDDRAYQLYKRARANLVKYSQECYNEQQYLPEFKKTSLDSLTPINMLLKMMDNIAGAGKSGGMLTFLGRAVNLKRDYEEVKGTVTDVLSEYKRIGDEITDRSQKDLQNIRDWQTRILLFGFVANILVGVLLMLYFKRTITDRVNTIRANSERLASDEELAAELSGDDEIRKLDASFHAMTQELRAAAEREKSLFNNASDVICVLDGENRFTKINPACLRLWGFEPSELMFQPVGAILDQGCERALTDIAASKKLGAPTTFESRVKTRDGRALEVSWSVYWSETEQSLFCIVHDITDRKNAERVKKQFLSMISSDLKVPLSAISASVTLLLAGLSEGLTKMALDKLQMAKKNVARLLGLVNDLLQMTELDSGNLELNKVNCEIDELLRRSVQDVEGVAIKQNVTVEIQNSAGFWDADPDRIMQVIVNLLSNAIKFSPDGAKVILSAEVVGPMVEIKIIDQGRGIPESHKQAIFEKFKQVSAADGKRKSGTGLGLPICKQIVEEHGGSIGVDSVEGQGSTFWFKVPLKDVGPVRSVSLTESSSFVGLPAALKAQAEAKAAAAAASQEPVARRPLGRMGLQHKGLVLVGIPILFEIAFVALLSVVLIQGGEERERELRSRMISVNANLIMAAYFKMGALMSSGPRTEEVWTVIKTEWGQTVRLRNEILEMVKDNPEELARMRKADEPFDEQERFYSQAVEIMDGPFDPQNFDYVLRMRNDLLPVTARAVHKLEPLIEYEEKMESTSPEKQKQNRERQAQLLIAGFGLNALIAILLAVCFSRDITNPLRTLAGNTERLSAEEALEPLVDGSDEIAQLDQAFHASAQALSEARQKARAVFDNSSDVICTLDFEGKFTGVNPACEMMFGYPPKELVGKTVLDLVVDEDKDRTKSVLLGDYSDKPSHTLEERMVRADGTQLWVEWSASKPAADGPIFGIAHDITNRKELEQLKQDFLAVVSHDLRTPLTSITGVGKLMMAGAMGPVNDRVKDVINGILRSGDKLLELINDILDIEKLEAGHMQLILENVGLQDLLEKSIDSAAGKRRSAVEVALPPSTLEIRADKDRLVQALANVLNHAISAAGEESPVKVSVANKDNCVEISVVNQAPPMSDRARLQLFERFREVSAEDTAERVGTGLALPIARKIVESHGGSIGVSAAGTVGNEFWIRLPLEVQPVGIQA